MTVQPVVNYQTAIPQNSYYIDDKIKRSVYNKEDHIVKASQPQVVLDKSMKNTVYAIKGLKGSQNSNFYEKLSLGMIPYLLGSVTLIALYNSTHHLLKRTSDKMASKQVGYAFGLGVILYGLMKVLGTETIDKGVKLTTGVDLDMPYKKVVNNLPEFPNDTNLKAEEYHKVFESVDFPYFEMLAKQGALEGDRYKYYDKLAQRMGYKEKLNSPDQTVEPAVLEVATKATAMKNVSPYLWAATGVALAFQPSIENFIKWLSIPWDKDKVQYLPKYVLKTAKNSVVELWRGSKKVAGMPTYGKNAKSGFIGKALIISSVGSALFGILSAKLGFRKKSEVNQVDMTKDYKEC